MASRLWALRFYRQSRLPGYVKDVKQLSQQDLPHALRELVQAELERLAERGRRRKERRLAEEAAWEAALEAAEEETQEAGP